MVADAVAQQSQQYRDQSGELNIQTRGALSVAEAYGQGQAAVMRAEAARQASLENYRNGINATALANPSTRKPEISVAKVFA